MICLKPDTRDWCAATLLDARILAGVRLSGSARLKNTKLLVILLITSNRANLYKVHAVEKLSLLENVRDIVFEYGFALLFHPASWVVLGTLILTAWLMPPSNKRHSLRKILLILVLALASVACVWGGICLGAGLISVATEPRESYLGLGAAVMIIGGSVCAATALIAYVCVKTLKKINHQASQSVQAQTATLAP
jgi:hypothetical protein